MSDMNIGSRNIHQVNLNQGVSTPDKVGNLGGHTVTQAQVAQTPARGTGIGDKIANFFTSTLPKFFSAVGESISNFFSRLTAPTPQTLQLSFNNLDGVQGDTTPLSQDDRDFLHDYISGQIKSGHGDVGTFLRGNDEGSRRMGTLLLGLGTALSKDVQESLPKGGGLGFHEGKGLLNEDRGLGEDEQKSVVSNGVKVLKESWERLFGSDESSAKTAGARLPQTYKDIIAVGFDAIDKSDAPNKQGLKDKFLANLLLRGISPAFVNTAANSEPDMKSSFMELSKIVQNIANGIDIAHNPKETLHPDVLPQLGDFRAMKDNMLTAFKSTQGPSDNLILTMDEVKQWTPNFDMEKQSSPSLKDLTTTLNPGSEGINEIKDKTGFTPNFDIAKDVSPSLKNIALNVNPSLELPGEDSKVGRGFKP